MTNSAFIDRCRSPSSAKGRSEGIQQLKKYAQNALLWGQGKEALKREYYLYKAQVAPYDSYDDRMNEKILGNRVEQIIGQEVARWAARPDGKDENSANIQSHHND